MEQFRQESSDRTSIPLENLNGLTIPDLDQLPLALSQEAAEQQLDDMLEQQNFAARPESEQRAILKTLCEDFEVRWKLDAVSGNQFRFLAEAVAKKRFEQDQLAQFLEQNSRLEDMTVTFH